MSEPKPYTMDEVNEVSNRNAVFSRRILATVEALERAERERDASRNALLEHREDADRCIAAETKRRYAAEAERDALRALVGQRCDGIECDHARECDALKAALRDIAKGMTQEDRGCLAGEYVVALNRVTKRAREALGEVEK